MQSNKTNPVRYEPRPAEHPGVAVVRWECADKMTFESLGSGKCCPSHRESKRAIKNPRYTILNYAILYYSMQYYTILYHTTLSYTILCYTILYHTILCYTLPHYTVLDYRLDYIQRYIAAQAKAPATVDLPGARIELRRASCNLDTTHGGKVPESFAKNRR